MTTRYDKYETQFVYPENWKVTENESEGTVQISLESPQGCIWDLYLLPIDQQTEWLNHLMATMAEQYDSFEQEEHAVEVGGQKLEGFEVYFYCLDLLVSAHLIQLPPNAAGQSRVLMYQGESREFDKNIPVFQAMAHSLLASDN